MAICEKLLEVKDWKMYNSHTCIYIYIRICVYYVYTHNILKNLNHPILLKKTPF